MRICVLGLWHLGTVTAACLASAGHEVVGLDFDAENIQNLQQGQPPIFEPGLEDLVKQGLAKGRLRFTASLADAAGLADIVWVAFDTPVDDDDLADVEFVVERVSRLFPYLADGTLVLISSQVPVGTTRRLEQACHTACPGKGITFGYSPENLRLGKAIGVFTQPDRVVVGLRSEGDRGKVAALLKPFTERLEWMSVESAEMTKHALNAFLALSVTFINEIAALCEEVGADAKEVERGLKSEARIGPKAYLAPGGPFAGGTLARDVAFLTQLGGQLQVPTHLFAAVRASNEAHKGWARRRLQAALGDLSEQTVAIWGLTYKPGTDTLRRSSAVELCSWLVGRGARVRAHDPAVKSLPPGLATQVELCPTPLAALAGAAALVVATEWPDYLEYGADTIVAAMKSPLVIDANRFLAKTVGADTRIQYLAVGKARS
jgi:UDPglucose 6-dehydrogenase